MNITECITCPKCQKPFMKKSMTPSPKLGEEYFCHWCHGYWGIDELVNKWGYDLGDFGDSHPTFVPAFPPLKLSQFDYLAIEKIIDDWQKEIHPIQIFQLDTVSVSTFLTDEPVWKTEAQKQEAYEIVTRMFLGIPEYEEGCGNQGIELQGYPI